MSKLTKGEVTITIDGTEYTLKPTLQAFSVLGSRYDTYGELLGKVFSGNVPAIITVLRYGLGFNDQQAKKLPEMVFANGVRDLIEPCGDYVFRLFNSGKSADEIQAEQNAGTKDGATKNKGGKDATEEEGNPLMAGN